MDEVILNTKTGERGTVADWVGLFAQVWEEPRQRLERLLALLDENIVLEAPDTIPRTVGRDPARLSFLRLLRAMPDLRGKVHTWEEKNGYVFIDMSFEASIGGRVIKWPNTDRVRFQNGAAVERIAYFDPQPVQRAFLRNPKGWSQLARLRAHF